MACESFIQGEESGVVKDDNNNKEDNREESESEPDCSCPEGMLLRPLNLFKSGQAVFFIVDVKKKSGSNKNESFSFLPHCATAKKCPRGKCDLNKKTAPKEEKADKMCDPGPPCSTC